MKRMYFGITLMISASILIAGAFIAGGAWASGMGLGYHIGYAEGIGELTGIGAIIFLIGFIVSGIEAIKKEDKSKSWMIVSINQFLFK